MRQTTHSSSSPKPAAAVSVDLDGLNILLTQFKLSPIERDTMIYEDAVPRLLKLFGEFGISATFFVIGEDLRHDTNVAICRDILASGHEIGNHSFTHGPDYASGTVTQKSSEIERCHHLIANTLGFQPRAFRGPGFVIDRDHLITLKKLNYLYDSSVLPCPYASLIMSIALPIMAGTRSFIKYGQARHGFAPLHAYHLDTDRITTVDPKSKIIELPAAVHPLWRSPLHATYLFSAGKRYFDAGASALRKRDLPYFLVLHGSDLFDEANEPRLKSFSTFRISVHKRLDMLKFVLHRLCVDFELIRGDRLAESMI